MNFRQELLVRIENAITGALPGPDYGPRLDLAVRNALLNHGIRGAKVSVQPNNGQYLVTITFPPQPVPIEQIVLNVGRQ